jgi:hypothetical protein
MHSTNGIATVKYPRWSTYCRSNSSKTASGNRFTSTVLLLVDKNPVLNFQDEDANEVLHLSGV